MIYPYGHRQERRRLPLVIILALVALLGIMAWAVVATCAKSSQPGRGTLVVGTNTPFPPFEIRKGEEVIGFDIDLAKYLAKNMDRKLIVKDFSEFDALLPEVTDGGSLDMAISSITIRDDRKEVVSFSNPYFKSSQALLTAKTSTLIYSGPGSLKGLRVGYQQGTTSQSWVEENLGKGSPNLIPFGDVSVGLQMILFGSVDVIVIDEPVAKSFAKTNSNLKVAGTIETGEEYGVVVTKGDPKKLLSTVNKTIKKMRENGEYDKLIAKWFGGGVNK